MVAALVAIAPAPGVRMTDGPAHVPEAGLAAVLREVRTLRGELGALRSEHTAVKLRLQQLDALGAQLDTIGTQLAAAQEAAAQRDDLTRLHGEVAALRAEVRTLTATQPTGQTPRTVIVLEYILITALAFALVAALLVLGQYVPLPGR